MSIRSSVKSRKNYIAEKIETLAKLTDGEFSSGGEYPEWTYRANSPLQKLLCDVYKEKYNEELKIEIIHAGLECGYILEKKPDVDVVSFGPQMYDIHTTDERVSIPSVAKLYDFVLAILENIK
jgi:dipeptidase D